MQNWVPVAALKDVPVGTLTEVMFHGGVIGIARTESGVYAFDNNCAHMGVALSAGRLNDDHLICPLHNWEYDLRSGTQVYPNKGAPFRTFATKIHDGTIWVADDENTCGRD